MPLDLEEIESSNIASSRTLFDDFTGVAGSDLTSEEVDILRPFAYTEMAFVEEDLLFKKVHDAWSLNADGLPIFPEEATKAVIYLIRNPLDVTVSYAFHSNKDFDEMLNIVNNESHSLCNAPGKLHNQLRQIIYDWSGHVESWVDRSGLPVLVIRYEDMSKDPFVEFRKAFDFIGLHINEKDLKQAIKNSEFHRISELEKQSGFREKPLAMDSFFRSGNPGDWKNYLNKSQENKLIQKHRSMMARFGYL